MMTAPIPSKLKEEMNNDPEYQGCMLRAYAGHICGGRPNTREHAILYGGKRLRDKKWAIISVCARGHEVDEYQDAGTMNKDLNVWCALNRASDEELLEYPRAGFIKLRVYLNSIYGEYSPAGSNNINY